MPSSHTPFVSLPILVNSILSSIAVIASLKDREEGIRTLTLSFTGTTEEVDAARKQSESIKRMTHGDGESTIRDWTGSGEEHHPQMGSEKV